MGGVKCVAMSVALPPAGMLDVVHRQRCEYASFAVSVQYQPGGSEIHGELFP
jgi:hypothetical protein